MYSKAYVEITNECNMHCSFCHGHHRPLRRMSTEEFTHVLDQLAGKTRFLYYHVMGEPLTHPRLGEFLALARERGFSSILTTNGTLLRARGGELIQAGVHKVSVSLHSFESGSEAAQEMYLSGVCDFAEEASNTGIIVVLRLWNEGFDEGRNERTLTFLRQRLAGEWMRNTKGVRIHHKLHLEWGERFAWPDSDAPMGSETVFCYGLRDHFGILSDGTVVPCCLDCEGTLALGNVFETPLEDILSSRRACGIREGFDARVATEELCRRCGYARRFS